MQRLGVRVVQHSKIALVTGASRGIGRATALALAETGARVLSPQVITRANMHLFRETQRLRRTGTDIPDE